MSDRSKSIMINLVGQVMQNLAAVLMSHGQHGLSNGRKRPVWFAGVPLLLLGAISVFASYGAAEQSLLGSLISVQFISNVVFGRLLFGRLVTLSVIAGTTIIVAGTTLCISNTPHVEREWGEDALRDLYINNPSFQQFLLCEVVGWLLLDRAYTFYNEAEKHGERTRGSHVLLPWFYIARAALPSSYAIIAAKTLASLLRLCNSGRNVFHSVLLWISLGLWVGGTVFWMRRMNTALRRFDSAFAIPLCQVNWSFFTVIGGGVFYHEFEHFTRRQMILFSLGSIANLSGAILLRPSAATTVNFEREDLGIELLIT